MFPIKSPFGQDNLHESSVLLGISPVNRKKKLTYTLKTITNLTKKSRVFGILKKVRKKSWKHLLGITLFMEILLKGSGRNKKFYSSLRLADSWPLLKKSWVSLTTHYFLQHMCRKTHFSKVLSHRGLNRQLNTCNPDWSKAVCFWCFWAG